MENIFVTATWLSTTDNNGYGTWPIPNSLDDRIAELLDQWQSLKPDERIVQAPTISDRQRAVLSAYSERMASQAVRTQRRDYLFHGLLALGIDGWRDDWRENVLLLCLYTDACKRIGVTERDIFGEASKCLPFNVSAALNAFSRRKPEDKSLESMGYEVSSDADGFRYMRIW